MYYFAPQKCFASDGGLWLAACSPAAVERIERIGAQRPLAAGVARPRRSRSTTRSEPDLQHAGARDAGDARRPARLDARQRRARVGRRTQRHVGRRRSTGGPSERDWATPFVADPAERSNVVGTIDLDDAIDANTVCDVLRANGIVDTDAYRKLGRNQLRIGMFPAIDPADVEALTPLHRPRRRATALTSARPAGAANRSAEIGWTSTATSDETRRRAVVRRPGRSARLDRPVMLVGLGAGSTWPAPRRRPASPSRRHRAVTVGAIDPDPFYDFTQQRPHVSVDDDVRDTSWPSNEFTLQRNPGHRDIVGLIGVEPHLRGRRTSTPSSPSPEALGCEAVVTVGSAAEAIPHTRTPPVTGSTADADLAAASAWSRRRTRASPVCVGVLQAELDGAQDPVDLAACRHPALPHQPEHPMASAALVQHLSHVLDAPSTPTSRTTSSWRRRCTARSSPRTISSVSTSDALESTRLRPAHRGGDPNGRRARHEFEDFLHGDGDGPDDDSDTGGGHPEL